MHKNYDIIGDIHGHGEKLQQILTQLGYTLSKTGYFHPRRKVIFVGDFIDRGEALKQHEALLDIVIPMVENGHALAVMGNHEFNALAYHTQHNGEY
ncbi:metallophosphoesterase [Vibrio sp.]|nr:metallophosphoesterase [Vibrio sp.]